MTSLYWSDLSTEDFARRALAGTVVILPVGATEQHGPHLPVKVDAAINAAILERFARLAAGLDVLILPPLPIGKSDEHLAFPGTLAISGETLRHVWLDVARSVARAGARRLVLFNSHGGQAALMDIACRDMRIELGVLAVGCSWFRITPLDDLFDAAELTHGIHGGDVETSAMLAAAPDRVMMEKAENFESLTVALARSGSRLTAEGRVGFGWQAQDLHPAGVCGDASRATAAKGEIVLDRAAAALLALVRDVADFDLARLGPHTRFSPAP